MVFLAGVYMYLWCNIVINLVEESAQSEADRKAAISTCIMWGVWNVWSIAAMLLYQRMVTKRLGKPRVMLQKGTSQGERLEGTAPSLLHFLGCKKSHLNDRATYM